jgi:hypothetical protein
MSKHSISSSNFKCDCSLLAQANAVAVVTKGRLCYVLLENTYRYTDTSKKAAAMNHELS